MPGTDTAPNPLQDKDFLAASRPLQDQYLNHVDQDYAKASPEDRIAYLNHIRGEQAPTTADNSVENAWKPAIGNALSRGLSGAWSTIKSRIPSSAGEAVGNAVDMASGAAPLKAVKGAYDEYKHGRETGQGVIPSLLGATGLEDTEGIRERASHGDIAGLVGQAVPDVIMTVLGAEAPRLKGIRENVGNAIHSPETGELTPKTQAWSRIGGGAVGGAVGHYPGAAVGVIAGPSLMDAAFPESMERVGQRNANVLESRMGEVEKARQKELGQWERLREQDAQSRMRRGREVDKQSSGIPNLNVMNLPEPMELAQGEKPGSMYSVNRKDVLKPAAQRGKAGAGDVLRDLGQPILYTPREGVGYPGPRTSETTPVERPEGSTLERARTRLKKSTEREPQE